MMSSKTEPKPLRERWLPQASIRFFLFLIGLSALVMYIFRLAILGDQFWAKIVSLLITTTAGCFAAYAVVFLTAHLFIAATLPFRRAVESPRQRSETDHDDFRPAPGGP